MQPKFTLGFALYDIPPVFFESFRATFTAMSAMIHHPLVGEVIVVDNKPDQTNPIRNLPGKSKGFVRYIEMPEMVGTSQTRNRVFAEAKFEYVAVCDPHVLLYPETFEELDDFYTRMGRNFPDVLHGCMMDEAGNVMATHMNDQWRAEMLGTWGIGWEAKMGWAKGRKEFSVLHRGGNSLEYVTLNDDGKEQRLLTPEEITRAGLPLDLGWSAHERRLIAAGCRPMHENYLEFRIPGHGMGFWACRKDSWLPFDSRCRGFGGEEITTGIRYRQAGRNAWCIPGAKWWHHFDRPMGTAPYSLTTWNKVRNYVLEFQNLGLDLTPIREHFPHVPRSEWEEMQTGKEWPDGELPGVRAGSFAASPEVERLRRLGIDGDSPDPTKMVPKIVGGCKAGKKPKTEAEVRAKGLEAMYAINCHREGPLKAELPRLHFLAAHCGRGNNPGRVCEIVHQSMSGIALLAGRPVTLHSYGTIQEGRVSAMENLCPEETTYEAYSGIPDREQLPENDFLFVDVDPHTGEEYQRLLEMYAPKCRRYIAVHDTVAYGREFNGKPGLIYGLDAFLKRHEEWTSVMTWRDQNGLTVLSRNPKDADVLASASIPMPVMPEIKQANDGKPAPLEGPGTELKKILHSIGVDPSPDCPCNTRAAEMNVWGPDKCEENLDKIVAWMREGQDKWGWREGIAAAARAVANGLAFKLNPLDPYPSLVRQAIKQSREKEATSAK